MLQAYYFLVKNVIYSNFSHENIQIKIKEYLNVFGLGPARQVDSGAKPVRVVAVDRF